MINLENDNIESVQAMVNFRYGEDVLRQPGQKNDLILFMDLYTVAEKYGVEGLRKECAAKFKAAAEKIWKSKDFLDACRTIYTLPTDDMKPLQGIMEDIIILNVEYFLSRMAFHAFLKEISGPWSPLMDKIFIMFKAVLVDAQPLLEYKCG